MNFTPSEIERLIPAILRHSSIDDATFGGLAAEAGIVLRVDSAPRDVVVSFPFVRASSAHQLPITELAAASTVMWEISLRVTDVLGALGVLEPLEPPEVNVKPGSTSFSFGGGTLLVSGIGLVIAAHAALPFGTAALIAHWGGSVVSLLGMTDLILSWRRSSAEVDKLQAETGKLKAEEQKILIETERLLVELREEEAESLLKAAQERLRTRGEVRANSRPTPASALLPQEEIVAKAKKYGIWPPFANHLINQVVPAVADATRSYPRVVTFSSESSAQAAGVAGAAKG